MKTFLIGGCIADEIEMPDDVTPKQIQAFLESLDDGEEACLEINSYGGSCTAGLAIANLIKSCGHKTAAHVVGIAASISSVIACSCDELKMDSNAFLMIHNPWSCVQGNSNDLRKEADTLDKFKMALVSIYRSKFNLPSGEIERMMDDESWILGEQSEAYKLACEVIPSKEPLNVSACIDPSNRLNGIPNKLKNILKGNRMENTKSGIKSEAEPDEKKEPEDQESEEKEEKPEDRVAELEKEIEELKAKLAEYEEEEDDDDKGEDKETVSKDEADRRVSGMQSAMQAQMNDLKKDYEAKLEDLNQQRKTASEELARVNDKVIGLADSLEKSKKELEAALSALKDRQNALDTLNSNVLTPAKELPTMNEGLARCKTPSERIAFLKSGKYTV